MKAHDRGLSGSGVPAECFAGFSPAADDWKYQRTTGVLAAVYSWCGIGRRICGCCRRSSSVIYIAAGDIVRDDPGDDRFCGTTIFASPTTAFLAFVLCLRRLCLSSVAVVERKNFRWGRKAAFVFPADHGSLGRCFSPQRAAWRGLQGPFKGAAAKWRASFDISSAVRQRKLPDTAKRGKCHASGGYPGSTSAVDRRTSKGSANL